jgi:hypothetical protein
MTITQGNRNMRADLREHLQGLTAILLMITHPATVWHLMIARKDNITIMVLGRSLIYILPCAFNSFYF